MMNKLKANWIAIISVIIAGIAIGAAGSSFFDQLFANNVTDYALAPGCVQASGNGLLTSTGGGCGSSGSGTVATGVKNQMATYAANGNTVSGSTLLGCDATNGYCGWGSKLNNPFVWQTSPFDDSVTYSEWGGGWHGASDADGSQAYFDVNDGAGFAGLTCDSPNTHGGGAVPGWCFTDSTINQFGADVFANAAGTGAPNFPQSAKMYGGTTPVPKSFAATAPIVATLDGSNNLTYSCPTCSTGGVNPSTGYLAGISSPVSNGSTMTFTIPETVGAQVNDLEIDCLLTTTNNPYTLNAAPTNWTAIGVPVVNLYAGGGYGSAAAYWCKNTGSNCGNPAFSWITSNARGAGTNMLFRNLPINAVDSASIRYNSPALATSATETAQTSPTLDEMGIACIGGTNGANNIIGQLTGGPEVIQSNTNELGFNYLAVGSMVDTSFPMTVVLTSITQQGYSGALFYVH